MENSETISITCIKRDEAGNSYFADDVVALSSVALIEGTPPIYISKPGAATSLFSINPGHWAGDFHVAPKRQYVILLAGELEVTTGDGQVRRFKAGDIVLAEDTTGNGHKTVNPSDEPVVCVVVQVDA